MKAAAIAITPGKLSCLCTLHPVICLLSPNGAALHGNVYNPPMVKRRPAWDAGKVKALRQHLGLTQEELARRMGTRQQTISEWETGMYAPRGVSERMLGMVAETAGFEYETEPQEGAEPSDTGTGGSDA